MPRSTLHKRAPRDAAVHVLDISEAPGRGAPPALAARALIQGLAALNDAEFLRLLLERAEAPDAEQLAEALVRRFGSAAATLAASQAALSAIVPWSCVCCTKRP